MVKLSPLLSLSFFLVVLFHAAHSHPDLRWENKCQLDRLNALDPDNRFESEGGLIESWNPNRDQFRCANVAVVRRTLQPNGLLLPFYSNAPQLVYVVQGRGMTGALFPGCAETFQESQQLSGGSGRKARDQHQKIRHFRRGDIFALPAGVAHWCYNNGNEPVVFVSVYDTGNSDNQLDNKPRNFHIAGNPEDEFQLQFQSRRSQRSPDPRSSRPGQQSPFFNIFSGLDSSLLAEAFNIDQQLASKLQSKNDRRGNIVKVEGGFDVEGPYDLDVDEGVVRLLTTPGKKQKEENQSRKEHNGIEETFCSMRMGENIADPKRADVYIPEVGRLSTVNSHNLPILRWLQLSASHVVLRNNAVRLPHWHMDAHSVIYAVRGQARIQVVDENGNNVFDGKVREGQVLTVPQNFVVVKRAVGEIFEYVAFKTNDNAMTTDLSGRTSALRGMPVEVIANAFTVSIEDATRIKFARQELSLGSNLRSQTCTTKDGCPKN